MNIIFFGNPLFSAKSLEHLNNMENINIKLVVTNIDKRMGRGLKPRITEVKKTAIKYSNKLLEVENLKSDSFLDAIKKIKADLFIVVGYRYLQERIYSGVKYGAINLHASLLPKYRGASPIQYAIMNGDKTTGLTTFYLNNKIDQGNIICQEKCSINNRAAFEEVYFDLINLSKKVLMKTIDIIISEKNIKIKKNNYQVPSYAPKIGKEDFIIDWSDNSVNIHNKIRALSYKGAYALYNNRRIKFFDTYFTKSPLKMKVGEFYYENNDIYIKTGNGYLSASKIQLEGARVINTKDFYNTVKEGFNKFD